MEEQWIVDRTYLRTLRTEHPTWTNVRLAEETGRSLAWVKKWRTRLKAAAPEDEQVLLGLSRRRKTPPVAWCAEVVERIKAIRQSPPANLGRVPGPQAILYYLGQDAHLAAQGCRLPKSAKTVWKLLHQAGCYIPPPKVAHEPVERPAPMRAWEMDFKDVSSVPSQPDGKRQHTVEVLNFVDRGTSCLVDGQAHPEYTAETALAAITHTLRQAGCPDSLRFDRDPRFVGSPQGSDFPSALVRFLLCLGILPEVCPPRRPDKNPFVERYHRTYAEECLRRFCPDNLEAVHQVNHFFHHHYNFERPNQALSCGNRPPRVAFPLLPNLPRLPERVDPNHWLLYFHGKCLKRRVTHNGSIQMGKYHYYIRQKLKGHYVVVKMDAHQRAYQVYVHNQKVKSLPIKGLHSEQEISFDEFYRLMLEEARSEWQCYLRRAWLKRQAGEATM